MITNSVQKSQEKHKIEEWASSADRSHPPSALCRNQGNKKICRQFSYWQWPNNKYEKLQSSYDLKKYCICWQCRCIDNLNRECWWFLYINVFASSLPRFRNCLYLEHVRSIELTPYEGTLLYKYGKLTIENLLFKKFCFYATFFLVKYLSIK